MASDFPIHFEALDALARAMLDGFSKSYRGVVVSLSGGPDSTALSHYLCQKIKNRAELDLIFFHVNFGLRTSDSDEDEGFCRVMARELDVPLQVEKVVWDGSSNIQEWARSVRREHWCRFAEEGFVVATAHHADDVAESVLMRLARGSSSGNSAGMQVWAPPIWRPFLTVGKATILNYLEKNGLRYRVDQTNASDVYTRNRLRNQVLPVLEDLYRGASGRIADSAMDAADVEQWAEEQLARLSPEAIVNAGRGVRRLWAAATLKRLGAPVLSTNRAQLDAVWEMLGEGSRREPINLAAGARLLRQSDGTGLLQTEPPSHKRERGAQHQKFLACLDVDLALSGNSHVILSHNGELWQVAAKALAAGSARLRIYCPSSSQKIRFEGYNESWTLKSLLQRWQISHAARTDWHVVEADGTAICLTDGKDCYVPSDSGERLTQRSLNGILKRCRGA